MLKVIWGIEREERPKSNMGDRESKRIRKGGIEIAEKGKSNKKMADREIREIYSKLR